MHYSYELFRSRGVTCGDLHSRGIRFEHRQKTIFLFLSRIRAYLHKYKLQMYYVKLVHRGIVVTTRALQVQGIGVQFWPGVHLNSSPSRTSLFHRCMGGIASVLSEMTTEK